MKLEINDKSLTMFPTDVAFATRELGFNLKFRGDFLTNAMLATRHEWCQGFLGGSAPLGQVPHSAVGLHR